MTIKSINHQEEMRARLPSFLYGATNLNKLLNAMAVQYQALEDTMIEMLKLRSIDDSIGQQLDGLGQVVDIARIVGQSDDDYRVVLRTRMNSLTKSGEVETIIRTFLDVTQSPTVQYVEIYPATIEISGLPNIDTSDPGTVQFVLDRMLSVKAAGVNIIMSFAGGFTLDRESNVDVDGNGPEDIERGFGSALVSQPGGGGLSGLIGTVPPPTIPPAVPTETGRTLNGYGLNTVGL